MCSYLKVCDICAISIYQGIFYIMWQWGGQQGDSNITHKYVCKSDQ